MKGKEILEAAHRHKEINQANVEHQELLKFSLDQEWYGVSIENVVEVIKYPKIFRIPHTPDYIVGVVNLRGEILAIVNIKKLMELPVNGSSDKKHIVVIERNRLRVGIAVDRASGIISIPVSIIKPCMSTTDRGIILGEVQLQGEVLAVLDLNGLLEEPKFSITELNIGNQMAKERDLK